MKKLLIIAAVALVAGGAGWLLRQELAANDVAAINSADVSTAPVAFTLPDIEGQPRDFAEWDGKARIVNFWATWCAPCRREIPLLKALQDKYADDGVQVIGVAVDFPEEVALYAEEAQFNYPVLVGQEEAMAIAESSGVQFIGLPFTMMVAGDGQLVAVHLGEIHEPQLEKIVATLTALDAGQLELAAAREALKTL